MKKQIVAAENFGKKAYATPSIKIVELQATDIICTSGDEVTVSDPWSGNTEEEW